MPNDGALGLFWRVSPQQKQEQQQPDEKRYWISSWSKNYFVLGRL